MDRLEIFTKTNQQSYRARELPEEINYARHLIGDRRQNYG